MSGHASDRMGPNALHIEEYANQNNYGMIGFDYLGHGDSDLKFQDCGIDTWFENSLHVIEKLARNPVVLIGSSLGGWLSLLCNIKRPEKVKALLTIAAAPDFTEDLMWDSFNDDIKNKINNGEIYNLPNDECEGEYPISKRLIESGREHFLLKNNYKIQINNPVTLLHGVKDKDVPYNYSQLILDKLTSKSKKLILIENGDHRLSTKDDLNRLTKSLNEIIKLINF